MATANPNATDPIPLKDTSLRDRILLVRIPARAPLGGIAWAYKIDDAVPYDQLLAIIASIVASGPAGGDLSGTYPNPTVDGLQGNPVSAAAPALLDVLTWDGAAWVPAPSVAGATLLATQVGFGDGANLLTGSADLIWDDAVKDFTANGTIQLKLYNSVNVFWAAQGNVGYWFTGAASTGLLAHQGFGIDMKTNEIYTMGAVGLANNNYIEVHDTNSTVKVSTLAGGGTQMVTVDNAGILGAAAIPAGGSNADYNNSFLLMGG